MNDALPKWSRSMQRLEVKAGRPGSPPSPRGMCADGAALLHVLNSMAVLQVFKSLPDAHDAVSEEALYRGGLGLCPRHHHHGMGGTVFQSTRPGSYDGRAPSSARLACKAGRCSGW